MPPLGRRSAMAFLSAAVASAEVIRPSIE